MALRGLVRCCRSTFHEPVVAKFCAVLNQGWLEQRTGAKRYLLSEDVIKLQDFQLKKLAVAHLASRSEGSYIDLWSQRLERNELIQKEELKLLLHLCQSADDMLVARKAIYRFHADNTNMGCDEFRFGPLFMRLCYEFGLEGMASAVLTDEKMRGFFNDTTSFNITLDMLFMKDSFEDALEVLRVMKKRGVWFNTDTLLLASGICYKLNTREAYGICTDLMEDSHTKGHMIPKHAFCFTVALALRQNDMEGAQYFFSKIINKSGRLCHNLRVLMLTRLGETAEALSVLSAAQKTKSPLFVKKAQFAEEVVDLLRRQSENTPQKEHVQKVLSQLEESGQVVQHSIDDMLCHSSNERRRPPLNLDQRGSRRRSVRLPSTVLLSE
ncbi:pentatricopeptide repeat-containing protein 2, mitochondrial [Synchiropus splendidus]|uniref:pentatricopeptide repeat-containing protein 2, mitochondrial n=1 Tax=Synchiropus splendidus TaxID=270530 RepID=UPI00237D82F2|nr:pentatricopeptide repeat-containing protein 2, mitochondrial [Synchiropus splendidus]